MENKKIQSFTDLIVWQKGHQLVLGVYRLSKAFPKDEWFALVAQIRRAVVSITSNIAEGFGRNSEKEKLHFYAFAYGSLLETQNQLLIAKDLGYVKQMEMEFDELKILAFEVGKMLQGLIKSIKNSPNC